MSESNEISANDFNELRRKKAETARAMRESTVKIQKEKLEQSKANPDAKIDSLRKKIQDIASGKEVYEGPVIAANLLPLRDETILDLLDTRTNFIERCLLIVEIKRRCGEE